MGQYWRLICPEVQQVYGNWGKLGEFLFSQTPEEVIEKLAIPQPDSWVKAKLSPVPLSFPDSASPLLNLPTELLDEIIAHLPLLDLFVLALCSQRLYYACRRRIMSILASQCGQLAGTSLICVGDYLQAGDYPPGIDWIPKIEELEKQLAATPGNESEGDSEDEDAFGGDDPFRTAKANPNLYFYANAFYKRVPRDLDVSGTLTKAVAKRCSAFWSLLLARSYKYIPDNLDMEFDKLKSFNSGALYHPNGLEWVLRNLTTKEYVRRSVVGPGVNGPFSYGGGVGLGHVLLSRICWSSDSSTAMSWDGIHRGIWAGHKFDITAITAIEGDDSWKDVSVEAYEDIKAIWKSEYGAEWEEYWRIGYRNVQAERSDYYTHDGRTYFLKPDRY
ncbi:hypothetical protein FN846DRAFT_974739 [Sphaerosporella brunnea]|uniref:F-box domain-containing protein n=1 Tax=Sphaerosporella brunnea TaxID=1250544 RepID=A0A5J5EGC1_9PEZI|nr:hypothetical protein FN846DRAFT_974739 [Sphaerosporella brunnea]